MIQYTVARTPSGRARERGLSLVELLVALFIGLLLLTAVVQVFSSSTRTSRFQQALSRVQETGRYAVDRIQSDFRMAGYQGCGGSNTNIGDYRGANAESFSDQFRDGVQGFQVKSGNNGVDIVDEDGNSLSKPPFNQSGLISPKPGTGGLLVNRVTPTDVVFDDTDPPALDIKSGNRSQFDKCDVVLMEGPECGQARVFIAGSSSNSAKMNIAGTGSGNSGGGNSGNSGGGNSGNSGGTCGVGNIQALNNQNNLNQLSEPWPGDTEDARALRTQRIVYYINDSQGETALYRWIGNGQGDGSSEELVKGVERIHIEYGESTAVPDDSVDVYRDLSAVTDWSDVLSARISIVARSATDHVTDEPQTVTFPPGGNNTFTPNDHRLRKVFTTTVAFRNRLP